MIYMVSRYTLQYMYLLSISMILCGRIHFSHLVRSLELHYNSSVCVGFILHMEGAEQRAGGHP